MYIRSEDGTIIFGPCCSNKLSKISPDYLDDGLELELLVAKKEMKELMEKYAVETEKTSVKTASGHKHCSSCGATINPDSNVIHCKDCGTEPVEKK